MEFSLKHYFTLLGIVLFLNMGFSQGASGLDCEGINSFFVGSIIPNPSFEDQSDCPTKASDLDKAVSWEQATQATTDYFTEGCYMGEGFIIPPTPFPDGKSCVGIITEGVAKKGENYFVYQEYIGTHLSSKLEKDVDYTLKLHVGFGTPDSNDPDGDDIETAVKTPDKTTLVLYGYIDDKPLNFPIKTRECIEVAYGDEWEIISQITVSSNGTGWVDTEFNFNPAQDYKAIIIGGACNTTVDLNDPIADYVFIDNLILNKAEEFNYGEPIEVGSICEGNLTLKAPEISIINFIPLYQWYKDGVELTNENDPELFLGDAVGASGYYHVVISDGESCAESDSIYVDENNTYSMLNPGFLCVGETLTLDAGDGYETYLWSTGEVTQQITITQGGTYSVEVTKSNGCDGRDTIVIEEPEAIVINGTVTDSDYGMNNGSISVNVSGGKAPYNYSWSNGGDSNNINNLAEGTYRLTVTDNNGCTGIAEFTVDENPDKISVHITVEGVKCHGESTGSIKIEINGGVPPYDIYWPELDAYGDFMDDLPAEQYKFIITDSEGKEMESAAFVNQPDPLNIDILDMVDPLCYASANGKLTVDISGGVEPYKISWSHTSSEDLSFDNLTGGEYRLIVLDNNKCETSEDIELVTPAPLDAEIIIEDPSCYGKNDGYIQFAGLRGGVRPYRYFLNGEEVAPEDFRRLGEGDYFAEIIDDNGCEISVPFSLVEPDLIEINLSSNNLHIIEGDSASIYLEVLPGFQDGYTYYWDETRPGSKMELCASCEKNIVFPTTTTRFTYVATNGICTYTDEITITVESIRIYTPNAFTPNDDGINDKLTIGTNGKDLKIQSFEVFDRWGSRIYSVRNVPLKDFEGWDGTHNSVKVHPGTYFYKVNAIDNNGKSYQRQSTISILD